MSEMKSSQTELEARITRALQRQPQTAVPAEFAARVRAALPAQKAARPAMQAGRISAIAGATVLMVALFALAPHAAPNFTSFAFDLELLMLVELGGIAYWFAARRGV